VVVVMVMVMVVVVVRILGERQRQVGRGRQKFRHELSEQVSFGSKMGIGPNNTRRNDTFVAGTVWCGAHPIVVVVVVVVDSIPQD
jgi:hypothetical protein